MEHYLDQILKLEERLSIVRQYIFLFESDEIKELKSKIEKEQKEREEKRKEEESKSKETKTKQNSTSTEKHEEEIQQQQFISPNEVPVGSDYTDEVTEHLEEIIKDILQLIETKHEITHKTSGKKYSGDYLLLLLSTSEACQVTLLQQKWFEKVIPILANNPSLEIIESTTYLLLHGLMSPMLAPRIAQQLCNLLLSVPIDTVKGLAPTKHLCLLSAVGTLAHRGLLTKNNVDCDHVLSELLKNNLDNEVYNYHTAIRCYAGLVKSVKSKELIQKVFKYTIELLQNEKDIRTEVHLHAIISYCAKYEYIADEMLNTEIYFGIIQHYIKNKPSRYGSVDIRYFALQSLITSLTVIKNITEKSITMCDSVLLALPSQPLLAHLGADATGGQHPQMLGVLGLKAMALLLIKLLSSNVTSTIVYQHLKRLSVENIIATIGRCTVIDLEDYDEPPKVKSEIKNDRDTALYWGLVTLQKMLQYDEIMKQSDIKQLLNKCENGINYLIKAVKAYCDKTPDIASIFTDILSNVQFDILKAQDNKMKYVHRFVQLMRDGVDSLYEHTAAKSLFMLGELKLITPPEVDVLVGVIIDLMKRFDKLTPDNVESLYSLVHITTEVDSYNEKIGEIVELAISNVIPWVCSHQEQIMKDESVLEKYDFLVLVLLILFCNVKMTDSLKKSVQSILNVYGEDAGEITEYCHTLLN